MLEGVELHPDNWGAVAEHVGTKSQLDCMQHFLSLPIEDTFINVAEAGQGPGQAAATGLCAAADGPAGAKAAAAEAAAGQQDEQPIPFADAQNPVMAQVGLGSC
jgi:SWI/SNF related-matrix-associated actin-dependent regulator of chromatin subfamily C